MLSRSIETAQISGLFNDVIVSTDCKQIADIALKNQALVPFLRPEDLSDDYTGTRDVIAHAITALINLQFEFDNVCCLYATAPFTTPDDLARAQQIFQDSDDNTFVFAGTTYSFPVQRALRLDPNGYSYFIDSLSALKRSQDLSETYHDAGQFYWGSVPAWMNSSNILDHAKPLIIPRWRAQDIDTEEDWIQSEIMFEVLKSQQNIN
jgi:N-acylneuraminate cytidylyltransferase